MTKVYCSRCRYYQFVEWSDEYCNAPDNLVFKDNYLGPNKQKHWQYIPKKKNKDNNCSSYKLKWWARLWKQRKTEND